MTKKRLKSILVGFMAVALTVSYIPAEGYISAVDVQAASDAGGGVAYTSDEVSAQVKAAQKHNEDVNNKLREKEAAAKQKFIKESKDIAYTTIVYDANGGTCVDWDGTVCSSYEEEILVNYAYYEFLSGYNFQKGTDVLIGWNTAVDGSGDWYNLSGDMPRDIISFGDTVTLYAMWAPGYTVVFDGNGGKKSEYSTESDFTMNVPYGYSAIYNVGCSGYEREGYYLESWNTAADGSGTEVYNFDYPTFDITNAGEKVTLYAQWAPESTSEEESSSEEEEMKKFTITYYDNYEGAGESYSLDYYWDEASENEFYMHETSRYSDDDVEYYFAGWNTAADGSGQTINSQYFPAEMIPEDGSNIDLYAQWTTGTYSITYDANEGYGDIYSDSQVVVPEDFPYYHYVPDADFDRDGYMFSGWNTKADGTGIAVEAGEYLSKDLGDAGDEITLYAQWTKEFYTVEIDPNGGLGYVKPIKVLLTDKRLQISNVRYFMKGKYFNYLGTSKDATSGFEAFYGVYGDFELDAPLAAEGETVTLYPVWKDYDPTPVIKTTDTTSGTTTPVSPTASSTGIAAGATQNVSSTGGVSLTVKTAADGSDTVTVTNVSAKSKKTVTIPSTVLLNGKTYKVTGISANVLKKAKKLKKLVVPKTVKASCLKKLNLKKNKKLRTVQVGTKAQKKVIAKAVKKAGLQKKVKVKVKK